MQSLGGWVECGPVEVPEELILSQPCRRFGFDYSNPEMATNLDSDAALMLRVKRGDVRAFEELVEKYKQPVMNVVQRMLRDPTEAEDLAQNVFVQVYKSASRYKATAKFSTWLFTIARNLCLNELRRRSRHPADSLEASQTESEDHPARQYEDVKTFSPTENILQGELEQMGWTVAVLWECAADREIDDVIAQVRTLAVTRFGPP